MITIIGRWLAIFSTLIYQNIFMNLGLQIQGGLTCKFKVPFLGKEDKHGSLVIEFLVNAKEGKRSWIKSLTTVNTQDLKLTNKKR